MGLLELLIILIVVMWLLGVGFSFGGSLIHLLLVVLVIVIIYKLITRTQEVIFTLQQIITDPLFLTGVVIATLTFGHKVTGYVVAAALIVASLFI